jgi:hypothetical protein
MPAVHASVLSAGSDFKLTGTSITELKTGLRQVLESRDDTVWLGGELAIPRPGIECISTLRPKGWCARVAFSIPPLVCCSVSSPASKIRFTAVSYLSDVDMIMYIDS